MGISLFFDLKKVLLPSYLPLPPPKLGWEVETWYVCTFSRSPRCASLWSRLFSPISTPHSPIDVVFWSGVFISIIF